MGERSAGHDRNGMGVKGANAWASGVWAIAEIETGERAESLSLIALGVRVRELSGSDEPAPRSRYLFQYQPFSTVNPCLGTIYFIPWFLC